MLLTVAYFILFLGKNGRDERGRSIFGTACLIGMMAFLISIYIFAFIPSIVNAAISSFYTFIQFLQILYNIILLIQVVATVILRRLK